jgi:5-methylcytosine-specific restriction endonuclease McrA
MRNCRVCGENAVAAKTGPATCPTCRREKYLIVKRRYQKSPKGVATTRAREEREDVREKRRLRSAAAWVPHPKTVLSETERHENRKLADERYLRSPKNKAKKRRDYARRKAAIVPDRPVTAEDWLEIVAAHKNRCHYCRKRKILTIDHVIPLSKGGKHVKENLVPACRGCNSAKNNKITRLL